MPECFGMGTMDRLLKAIYFIHVLKAKFYITFSLLVMTSWESMALCSHYTCTPYRGVAVQLLLFILCDPLLLCDLLFIYLWRYSPSHDILGAEKPEGPFENLLELKNFFCPSAYPSSPSPGNVPTDSEKILQPLLLNSLSLNSLSLNILSLKSLSLNSLSLISL